MFAGDARSGVMKCRIYECLKCGRKMDEDGLLERTNKDWLPRGRFVTKCDCGFEWEFVHGARSDYWNEIEWIGVHGHWVTHQEGCLTIFSEQEV